MGRPDSGVMSPWFVNPVRLEGWQQRLRNEVVKWRETEFVWGETDCFCFAGACIEALTGQNPMNGVKGAYDSKKTAYRVLHHGAVLADGKFYKEDGVEGFWSYWLGEQRAVSMAQTGDIALCRTESGGVITGVMSDDGRNIWVMGDHGCEKVSKKLAVTSWQV